MQLKNFFTVAGQPGVINPGSFNSLLTLLNEPKMGIARPLPETITEVGAEVSAIFFTVPEKQTKGSNHVKVSFNKETMKVTLYYVYGSDVGATPYTQYSFDTETLDLRLLQFEIQKWLYPQK